MAGVQAPPLGLHTSVLLILPVSQDHRERKTDREKERGERRNVRGESEGESSDRGLERLIKRAAVKKSEIIEACMKNKGISFFLVQDLLVGLSRLDQYH